MSSRPFAVRLVATREGELFHVEVKANLVGLDRLKLRAAQIKEVGTGTVWPACRHWGMG
ncbi:hypothetical protein [Mesorhizobium sp.]|uniref:hypothetical protein n=1 Tax=Mesorhizobium sp. TaxID=1871066 RepID=UPI0025D182E2|nr:hypothetical protein [Mesorhizobium sp.]